MNKFEAVLLFNPDLTVANLNKLESLFKEQLLANSGSIIDQEDWGLRDLTYNIHSNKKAFYKYYQLEIESSKVQNIKKNLNQKEQIMRYLFIKVDNHEILPTKLLKQEG